MPEAFIVDAVRTPIGRRNGGLASVHPADLLARTFGELITRSGIDPAEVGQVVGGCVTQVGEQSFNISRTAWLRAGLPVSVAATTVDTQCGSSQQAVNAAVALVQAGVVDVAVAGGVEAMSRVPIGASSSRQLGFGVPMTKGYFERFEFISQFEAAERIADKWGIDRAAADAFGALSQERAARAWQDGRLDTQVFEVEAADRAEDGTALETTHTVRRDEGLRATSVESLAALKPVARPDGVHTAGTSSQISDGAAAVLIASDAALARWGRSGRARVVDTCLVGVDPVMMLTGPIDATNVLLRRNGMAFGDIDVVEINEAFASVVLAWAREFDADLERVNPNGGAIAVGHPLGATGAVLTTKALFELERSGGTTALVTMCCGGGLGTGTLLERVS